MATVNEAAICTKTFRRPSTTASQTIAYIKVLYSEKVQKYDAATTAICTINTLVMQMKRCYMIARPALSLN